MSVGIFIQRMRGLKNQASSWGVISRTLHWGMAMLILFEVIFGFVMSRTYMQEGASTVFWHNVSSQFHHTAGLTILALALVRILWRLTGPVPDLPDMTRTERIAAKGSHWLIYLLLFLIPLSGWAALSSLANSEAYGDTYLWFFGTNGFAEGGLVARIVPPVAFDADTIFRYQNFARSHRWLLVGGATLLTLHILAALRHHFVVRDNTLNRMWRG